MSEAEQRSLGHVRAMRVAAYLGMVAAGAILPASLDLIGTDAEWLWLLMCAWLVLGGILAGLGQVVHRWTGEFVGLPLLYSALAGFGILQGNISQWSVAAVPSVALLWAMSFFVYARWRDVVALVRAAPKRGRVP